MHSQTKTPAFPPSRCDDRGAADRPSSIDAPFMRVVRRPPIVMERGEGSYLWDESGRRYLDFVQGWAVNALGHAAPEIRAALAEQSGRLITPSPAYHNRPAIELARWLAALTGAYEVTFVSSGAEANETALKLCRKWGRLHKRGAFGVVSTHDAFHGRTLAAMAVSGKPGWDALFPPYPPGFRKVPFGDLSAMAAAVDESTVAIMVEPIQGEAGVVVPPPGYLRGLRELADRHDLLLVFDEVQTGCGRTGKFLAQDHAGVRADITTLGKGMGAGLPISAVLANARAACFEPGDHGSTHGGNALCAAVALEVCRIIGEPAFCRTVDDRSAELEMVLEEHAARFGGVQLRGQGLLRALVFDAPIAEALVEAARSEGLLVNAARPHILRLMPQLRVTSTEIEEFAVAMARARAAIA